MPKNAPEFARLAATAGIQLQAEVTLPWLTRNGHLKPEVRQGLPPDALSAIERIFAALGGDDKLMAAKTRGSVRADFLLPSGIQVEYDEVQHFTTARLETLNQYAEDAPLGFDLREYIEITNAWIPKADKAFAHKQAAEFPGERGRQRQRAYFDAFRDIAAPHFGNGPLIRIPGPDNDYESAVQRLGRAISEISG